MFEKAKKKTPLVKNSQAAVDEEFHPVLNSTRQKRNYSIGRLRRC